MSIIRDYTYLPIDSARPVVFLDLCGVLNNYISSHCHWHPDVVERRWLNHDHVDAHKADLLFALFRHYQVQVVMVTSWVQSYLSGSHLRSSASGSSSTTPTSSAASTPAADPSGANR